jgi:acyl-coenzyme A synthetase/AMP-(fatty) acid ligase
MPESPLIVRGGRTVPPHEVEQALLSHPAVAEAAVVGVPDVLLGQAVGAAVLLSAPLPSTTSQARLGSGWWCALAAHCRGVVPGYQVPERWLLVTALPRTPDGAVCLATVAAQLGLVAPAKHAPTDLAGLLAPRPAFEDLRIPRQVRRSWALEDL